jgi:hypothetical protein
MTSNGTGQESKAFLARRAAGAHDRILPDRINKINRIERVWSKAGRA